MSLIKVVCSHCGYTREVAAAALPKQRVKATCPQCKQVFDFDPAGGPERPQQPPIPDSGIRQPPPAPQDGCISLRSGLDAKGNRLLFALFLVLILVAVVVRLAADARYRAVPYPNLMAASSNGVAVACGRIVYRYATDGTLQQSYPLPAGIQPTQLFWDQGKLCLADMKSKSVLELAPPTNERKLTGVTIGAQFKVTREPATGHLFVSDGAGHRVLVFDATGRFLRSFGREGTNPGEFRFPNEMHFDESGQLLIANTKRPAIEVYSPDGQFLNTLVVPAGDKIYRYPTDLVLTPDRLLVLENDGFLNRAKIRSYDRQGGRAGELALGEAEVIGDIVAAGDRLLVSDCVNRQLLAYSLPDLRPLGPFSDDFARKCAAWGRAGRLYKLVSQGALIALLLLCVPVLLLYLRMKRTEAMDISQTDISTMTGRSAGTQGGGAAADPILGAPVNAGQLRLSLFSLGTGILLTGVALAIARLGAKPSFPMLAAVICGQLAFLVWIIFLVRSGGVSTLRRKQADAAFKRLVRDGLLALLPEEQVERVALAQHSQSAQNTVLLIFTNRRLLQYFLSWNNVAKIEQCPFEAIMQVSPPKGGVLAVNQCIRVSLMVAGKTQELKYYYPRADFLLLLGAEFTARIGKVSGLPYAQLCLTCRQPLQGEYCATCATKQAPNLQAMWLSLVFPGLGQLRNGELQKGLLYIVFTVFSLLVGYLGIKGWFFEGADLTLKQKFNVSVMIVLAPVWYVANIADAYRSSIRGRKP